MPTESDANSDSLAALVAIVRAAHLSKDRALERTARKKLAEAYGVDVTFRREQNTADDQDGGQQR